jgi:hypothetical protein
MTVGEGVDVDVSHRYLNLASGAIILQNVRNHYRDCTFDQLFAFVDSFRGQLVISPESSF